MGNGQRVIRLMKSDIIHVENVSFGRGLNSLRVRFTIMIAVACLLISWLMEYWLESQGGPVTHQLGGEGFAAIGLATFAAAAVTYVMTGKLTRPIENLKASAEAIAKGDYDALVTVDCNCEVGGLADSFRKMVARLNDNVAKINTLAYEDGVTGLPNRAVLDEVIQNLPETAGYVMFIDLDRLKQVNDIYGHQIGDTLLRKAAQRMLVEGLEMNSDHFRNCLTPDQIPVSDRECRLLFRFAGDEFVALVLGDDDQAYVTALATRIIGLMNEPFVIEDRSIQIGASIGIVSFADRPPNALEIIKRADLAMYEAKKQGRGRIAFFDEAMRLSAINHAELERDFPAAIAHSQFEVHYQPKISMGNGSICGLEALVRWRHPTRGLLFPAQFLPVVGSIGALDKIGREVMRTAACDIRLLRERGFGQRISVNVCPTQFADDAFARNLIGFVASLGVEPTDFQLEVTETIAMTDVDKANEHLTALRAAGFEIAIDDFGTGYSNLAQLTKLPYDCLKIDRSLIADIAHSHNSRTIVMAVVNMAHGLGHKVVVEGVEDAEQLSLLRMIGCDVAQGYFTGRPADLAGITRLLATADKSPNPVPVALSA